MTVIFDMDGLMFDTERLFIDAWDYAGEKVGIGKAGYMVVKTLGMNGAATSAALEAEFGPCFDWEGLRKYEIEYLRDYYEAYGTPVKKGLYSLLNYLTDQGAMLAVASSSSRQTVLRHLKGTGLEGTFSVLVCGDMISRSKPDPEIYLTACALLGAEPSEVYALEDSQNGLLAAHRAGCKPLMVPDLWLPDEETERILCGRFEDLDQVREFFEASERNNV